MWTNVKLCAWCIPYKIVPHDGSHGICKRHEAVVMKEIEQIREMMKQGMEDTLREMQYEKANLC